MPAATMQPAPAPPATSSAGLRLAVARRLEDLREAMSTAELRLADAAQGLDEQRRRVAEVETAWRNVMSTPAQADPAGMEEAFRVLAAGRADLAAIEERCRNLAARLDDLRRQDEVLRTVYQGLGDLAAQKPDGAGQLRDASRQVFEIIEEERMRIARDMHDGPAQSMANLVLQAEILERLIARDPQLVHQELADFKEGVRSVLDETRRLIFDLRPMTLDDLGLMPTLRKLVNEFEEKSRMPTRLRVVGEEVRLPTAYENTLFRIIQEALNNARKHSRATSVEVVVSFEERSVSALVKDNGTGFDVSASEPATRRGRRLGLTSMRERAQLEKGHLEIRSEPGGGTEVHVSFTY